MCRSYGQRHAIPVRSLQRPICLLEHESFPASGETKAGSAGSVSRRNALSASALPGNIQQHAIHIFPTIGLPGRPSLKKPLPSGSIMSTGGPTVTAAHRITRHCQKTI